MKSKKDAQNAVMPGKRKTRCDFSALSADANETRADRDDSDLNEEQTRVLRPSDAPTASKFYADAEAYVHLRAT